MNRRTVLQWLAGVTGLVGIRASARGGAPGAAAATSVGRSGGTAPDPWCSIDSTAMTAESSDEFTEIEVRGVRLIQCMRRDGHVVWRAPDDLVQPMEA